MNLQAAAQVLCDMPHTRDTRSLAIRYGSGCAVVGNGHARDGASVRRLLPQAYLDLVGLRMLGRIGRGLANNLQKRPGDARVVGKRSLNIDLNAHQAKGMNDIAELLRRLAVATATQVGGNRAQQWVNLLERFVVQASLFQISMEDGQALADHVVHAGTHAQVGRIVGNLLHFFDLGLELLARKLEQVVGLRQAVVSMRILRHIQTDNALKETARNHNVVVHK